ncbi:MAG: VWA domain-containing protein [Pyrinomonadaceae bacterium]
MLAARASVFVLVLLLSSAASFGQGKQPPKPAEDEVIRIDTELVEVPLAITDRAGRPILDLKKSNFTVFEDGKPQDIAEFSTASAPFEVVLLLDTSGSARSELQMIQRAAQNFINSLRPGDRVAIVAFRTDITDQRAMPATDVLSPLTNDRQVLLDGLERLATSNGTPYYDSLLKIAGTFFASAAAPEFKGRRALVALTDGVDSTSLGDFDEVRERFGRAGVTNYFIKVDTREFFEQNLLGDCQIAIRFSTAQIQRYFRRFAPNSKVETTSDFCRLGDFERLAISKNLYELAAEEMNALAKNSGGKVFPVADLSSARQAFKSVADEIGTKYSLGYYSSNGKRDGTYRAIKVEVKGLPSGTQVRAREGYTAPKN